MADVEFKNGLIALWTLGGDATGFSRAIPLSRRRKRDGKTWWEASVADAAAVLSWATAKGLQVDPTVTEYAATAWRTSARNMARATATSLGAKPMPQVRGLRATLLETQKAVVAAAPDTWFRLPGDTDTGHRAMILADDQGLGKTLTGLAILRTQGHESARAVIVCPTSLTANWVTEAGLHFAPGTFTPWVATTFTPSPPPVGVDVVVIGWDILPEWADTLAAWKPDAVFADEGHYAKSGKRRTQKVTKERRDAHGNLVRDKEGKVLRDPVMIHAKDRSGKLRYNADGSPVMEQEVRALDGSRRGSAILSIGKAVAKQHGIIMPMSGTPIVNRPLELLPMIEFCGVEKLFVSAAEFKERYCGPTFKKIAGGRTAKDYSGASNLMELNTRLLTSGVYFRRTKQVLVTAGLLQRKYVDKAYFYDYTATPAPWRITLTDDERKVYQAARGETRDFFATRAQEIAREKGIGLNTKLMQTKIAAEGAKHLKLITELRQAVGMLKVPHVLAQARALVERGEKVVIVAHHRDVVTAYADEFGGVRIQGAMGTKAIEEAKAIFNGRTVEEAPVLVLSVEAGKTGHTLCKQTLEGVGPACAYMILAEQVWTPADEVQVQDRIWRIGQDREVFISNALAADTIDTSIYMQRQAKRHVFNAAIDAIDQDAVEAARAERAGAGEIARQLVFGDETRDVT